MVTWETTEPETVVAVPARTRAQHAQHVVRAALRRSMSRSDFDVFLSCDESTVLVFARNVAACEAILAGVLQRVRPVRVRVEGRVEDEDFCSVS